jgi:hypothetical protein
LQVNQLLGERFHFSHTEPYLLACGISKVLLVGLLRDGLATQIKARAGLELPIDIVRVKITDAGRRALQ